MLIIQKDKHKYRVEREYKVGEDGVDFRHFYKVKAFSQEDQNCSLIHY